MNLFKYLEELKENPSSKLLIETPTHWMTLRTFNPSIRILIEVSCDSTLTVPLSNKQQEQLAEHGYQSRRNGRSIGKLHTLQDLTGLQNEITNVFQNIFEDFDPPTYSLSIQSDITLKNPELLQKMKIIANTKDHQKRIEFYQTLLNSEVITLQKDDGQFVVCDKIGAFDCFAMFTDEKQALLFDPRGSNLKVHYAFQAIDQALQQNVGSILINPKGEIRGELFRTELQSLMSVIRRN